MCTTRRQVYKKLFKKLLPQHDQIVLKFVNVQQQRGSNDCGLFAIGFFISFFNDEDPSDKLYVQDEMRQHFIKCNTIEIITDFSQISKQKVSSRSSTAISTNLKSTVNLSFK